MACGGLKSAERKIESRLLNRHHSVRVTDFGMDVVNYAKSIFVKSGRHLEVKVGIHTGPVISGVVGDTKPQFSLIGDTVNKTSRVCSLATPQMCTISKETHHYLELYTNNLNYVQTYVMMKGIGREPIFGVSVVKGNRFNNKSQFGSKTASNAANEALNLMRSNVRRDPTKSVDESNNALNTSNKKNALEGYTGNLINESLSNGDESMRSQQKEIDSHRGLMNQQQEFQQYQ